MAGERHGNGMLCVIGLKQFILHDPKDDGKDGLNFLGLIPGEEEEMIYFTAASRLALCSA
jgi:hypothetical protein